MKEYKFLAEASFDKSKVLNGIDTSNKNKASDASRMLSILLLSGLELSV